MAVFLLAGGRLAGVSLASRYSPLQNRLAHCPLARAANAPTERVADGVGEVNFRGIGVDFIQKLVRQSSFSNILDLKMTCGFVWYSARKNPCRTKKAYM